MVEPWLGTSLVAGTFAFVGVIAAQSATFWLESIKKRNADSRRWHADRRPVYARYLAACAFVQYELGRFPNEPKSEKHFSQLLREIEEIKSEITLIASDDVVEAAELLNTITVFCYLPNPEDRRKARNSVGLYRDWFIATVRKELGTTDKDFIAIKKPGPIVIHGKP